MNGETDSSETKIPRPRSSRVYFFSEVPQIAKCHDCEVFVPVPKKSKVHLFRKKKSELTLHPFGSCTIMLLESDAPEDIVNFSGDENQTPLMTIYLNRLIDRSLEHIVNKAKVWQEFHLNDQGKKRSFVLQFKKGPEFDEFYPKLQNVINTLHACREGKAKMNKKFILVGFKYKEPDEFIRTIKGTSSTESGSSDNSCSSDSLVHRPYNPHPHVSRVTGLDQVLERSKSTQSVKSDVKTRQDKYLKVRQGSISAPQSCEFLQTLDDPAWTVDYRLDLKTPEEKYNIKRNGSAPQSVFLQTVDDPAWTVDFRSDIKIHEEKYNKERYGSAPQSVFLQTVDDPPWGKDIKSDIRDKDTMNGDKHNFKVRSGQHENLEITLRITDVDTDTENGENVDNQNVKVRSDQHENMEKTLRITDIDIDTENGENVDNQNLKVRSDQNENLEKILRITDIDTDTENVENVDMDNGAKNIDCSEGFNTPGTDFEYTSKVNSNIADNNNLLPVGAENLTMKARQEQKQSKHYTQLLQTAINDGDQEKARQYADILAASHVEGNVLLNYETNELDINFTKNITPIFGFDSHTSASSHGQETTLKPENRLQFPQQYFQEQRARSMPDISMQSQQFAGYGASYDRGYSGSLTLNIPPNTSPDAIAQPVSGD
ncbi:uncharacterized protein [Mytilus edulis]|uniref:uncharacterized protein n=1 Tax=Mytilus edulis TaxID=6550 RepID=UPI0039EEFED1